MAPPHSRHASISMLNTHFKRCAHVMDARRSADLGGPSATLALLALPRFARVTRARCLLLGANNAVKACQIHTRLGHQGRETGNEIEWLDKIAGSDFEQPEAGPKSWPSAVVPTVAPAPRCERMPRALNSSMPAMRLRTSGGDLEGIGLNAGVNATSNYTHSGALLSGDAYSLSVVAERIRDVRVDMTISR